MILLLPVVCGKKNEIIQNISRNKRDISAVNTALKQRMDATHLKNDYLVILI